MAKSLKSMIRLHEWRVDEARRELGLRIREVERLEAETTAFERRVLAEQEIARSEPERAGFAYGAYANRVIERRAQLAASVAAAERAVAEGREVVREAYRELKKYELTQAERDRREAAERDRKDQIILDEVAATGHRLKNG